MYNASLITKYIICRHRELGSSINNLKLQNVLYFVQAEFLVSTDAPISLGSLKEYFMGTDEEKICRKNSGT